MCVQVLLEDGAQLYGYHTVSLDLAYSSLNYVLEDRLLEELLTHLAFRFLLYLIKVIARLYSPSGAGTWDLGWVRQPIAVLTGPAESMEAIEDNIRTENMNPSTD